MSVPYALSALLAAGLFAYLLYALLKAGEVLMTALAATLVGLLLVVTARVRQNPSACTWPTSSRGGPIWPLRALSACERGIYRLCGIDPAAQMSWKQYALCLLLFNALGALALYALQRWQAWLPLNPQKFAGVSPGSSFNHRGELHHQHQLAGLFRGAP